MAAVSASDYHAPAPAAPAGASARERCIIALDVPTGAEALALADTLGDTAAFYKIGLELFAGGDGRALLTALVARGQRVFADLKLYDVPETVARATRQIAGSGAHFLTVHGDDAIMRAAARNKGDTLKILAVTALTSLDAEGLAQLGYRGSMEDFVLQKAALAQAAGCDGVICSGHEVAALRAQCGEDFILVTPGIRQAADSADDQKRIAAPGAVIAAGGDYLVIGRPVRNAPAPQQALRQIIDEVENALQARAAGEAAGKPADGEKDYFTAGRSYSARWPQQVHESAVREAEEPLTSSRRGAGQT